MNLPYDEDYLREMELWTFFELRSQSSMPSVMQSVTSVPNADISTPVQPGAAPQQRARPSSPRRAAAPSTSNLAPPDPARTARIAQLDWDGLKMESAACQACGLCKQRKQAVLGVGAPEAPWLFIGEGPGSEEDDQGERQETSPCEAREVGAMRRVRSAVRSWWPLTLTLSPLRRERELNFLKPG